MGLSSGASIRTRPAAVAALVVLLLASGAPSGPARAQTGAPAAALEGADELDRLVRELRGEVPDGVADGPLLQEAFTAFLRAMEVKDGAGAVRLARAMHDRADAVWSAFCLEGALRRSAPADPRSEPAMAAFREAEEALQGCLAADPGFGDRLALVQRRAILAAGFDAPGPERAALGRALAMGGIDGAQILGLAALKSGELRESARLFAVLLDRGEALADCPWAVRGHGLAALAATRGRP